MRREALILCGALTALLPLSASADDAQTPPVSTPVTDSHPAQPVPATDTPPAAPTSPVAKPPSTPADTTPVATPATPTAPAPTGDNSPVQYNVDLPTGYDQRQPIYFTKDMTFNIGTTQIGFYGFIKFDYLGETRITGDTADILLNRVPLNTDKADRRTQSILDARSSRLGLKIEDSFKGIKMKGAVEGDFSTPDGNSIQSNSRVFRIRLAYATAELPSHFFFLVGQYYGILMHYPEIDMPTRVNVLHYPAGVVDCRQPQARLGYKQYFSDKSLLQYEVGAETQGYNTVGTVTPEGGDIAQACEQKWPLFNAKVSWLSDSLKLDVAGAGTRAYVITDSLGTRLHTPVWGVISNGSYTWKDLILWGTIHHWMGLTGLSSNYFNQVTLINHSTQLEAVRANGGAVALRYDFMTKKLWTDVMYGVEHCKQIEGSSQFSGTALKKIEDFRANLVGAFWKHWQIGIEYERTYVEAFNGTSGCDNMVHLGVWYVFGQP